MVQPPRAPNPFFTQANTRPAFQLRFYFAWHTYCNRPILSQPAIAGTLDSGLATVAQAHDWRLLEYSIEPTQLSALVSLRPESAPSDVTRLVKGNLATYLRPHLDGNRLWSRGWFLRSNGHVTNETVRKYVKSQYEHHNAAPWDDPAAISLARFHADTDPFAMRTQSHSAFEFNLHVVFGTRRRVEFLDMEVAAYLLEYMRRVCAKKNWIVYDIEIVWDHVHLFLGLQPSDAPGDVALSLMNNSAFALHRRYASVIRLESLEGIWSPGYYVGTVGAATTAQIKAHLEND